jgi:SAM-dependent methyltransferase
LPTPPLRSLRSPGDPFERFSDVSDQAWLELLIQSVDSPVVDGVPMPRFPADDVQRSTVGSSGAHALREGFQFFSVVKRYAAQVENPLRGDTAVLDFGCGWGRILRFFLKDCGPANLTGIDVDPGLVALCRRTIGYGRFEVVTSLPPAPFDDESFDVVTAYSVFSHLAEHASLAWVKEMARLLRPRGLLVVTTEGRDFIELCRSMQGQEHESPWHQALARSFIDSEAAYRAYDAGEFLYSATGGGAYRSPDFYGEAVIPEAYVRARWSEWLRVVDFADDPRVLPQALIVMQKS